jgi:uncharacterized protein
MESTPMQRRFLLLTAAASTVLTAVLTAAPPLASPVWARSNDGDRAVLEGLLRSHIAPRTKAFADAAQGLVPALDKLAAQPDEASLKAAREAYHGAMQAWAGVQHLRPGPLLLELRADRIAFWPDKRSVGPRQLGQLLTAQDAAVLAPGGIAKQSAAVQGLPALERLLFDDGVKAASFAGEAGAYRGKLAAAVGRNLAQLATEARDGWATLGPALLTGTETTPVGKGPGEALTNLFLSLVTAVQIVVDQKLLIPLGASAAEAKPALAEAARSARSLKQIAANLAAIRAMLTGESGGPGLVALADEPARKNITDKLTKAFDAAAAALSAVPEPLDQAVADPRKRPKAEAAFRAAKALQTVVTRDLPALIGVTIGFNELDGD